LLELLLVLLLMVLMVAVFYFLVLSFSLLVLVFRPCLVLNGCYHVPPFFLEVLER
jgi:hypothetical protein